MQHVLRRPAKQELAEAGVAIGAHDQEIGWIRRQVIGEHTASLAAGCVDLFGDRSNTVRVQMTHHVRA
jgi:hypothetical protein